MPVATSPPVPQAAIPLVVNPTVSPAPVAIATRAPAATPAPVPDMLDVICHPAPGGVRGSNVCAGSPGPACATTPNTATAATAYPSTTGDSAAAPEWADEAGPHPASAAFYDYVRGRSDQVPPGYTQEGLRVYRYLVYLGACQMVQAHYPELRTQLGEEQWRTLMQAFVRDSHWHSHFYEDLQHEFTRFLERASA